MISKLLLQLRRRGLVPRMSATERAALEAGDVWIEGELFSGRPDFDRILAEPYPELSEAEQTFLDGPVEEVCRRADPAWIERHRELPTEVWELLRKHRFFGLALPRRYGGHEFSALAMSAVFGKLVSRSMMLSSVVLIPNSVGPGELLLEVGTDSQCDYYLPRLARGEEIPAFALTETEAGSDAGSLSSRAVVYEGADGAPWLRLDWQKRYITLAPIATLLGLAVQLEDPEDLLRRGTSPGITCVLVPTALPGVEIGRHHDPMGIAFPNGPTSGRGVEIPASQIIGGPEYAGRGWQMLMEALSGGRAVSLPAQAVAGAKHTCRVTGAYAAVRRQFGLPIARFEGIEEPLARMAGLTYVLEAARVFTCGAVDAGHRPAVASAIIKYNATALAREIVTDGMDVLAGAGICRGPRNLLATGYIGSPIGVTVEGANILTRTLIVFGQGALRCHPYAHRLLEAVRQADGSTFLRLLPAQAWHLLKNALRCLWLGISRGRLSRAPVSDPTAPYYRRLSWASARLALSADLAILLLGAKLKVRGKLSGRFADLMSWLYLGTSTLRRWQAEGCPPEDLPLVEWGTEHCLAQAQRAYEGLLTNFDLPLIGWWLRGPALWWARLSPMGRPPSDRLGGRLARLLSRPGATRDRLIGGLFMPRGEGHALEILQRAFELAAEAEPLLVKLRRGGGSANDLEAAITNGLVSRGEADLIERAAHARLEAIEVDTFSRSEYLGRFDPAEQPTDPIPSKPAAIVG